MAAKCTICGRGLSFTRRLVGGGLCSSCATERVVCAQEARDEAQRLYSQALADLESDAPDPTRVTAILSQQAALTGWRDSHRGKLNEEALIRLADRALADDVLTEDEEGRFLAIATALGFSDVDLEQRFRDVLDRLLIARVNDGRLPTLQSPSLMLKRGEVAHAETSAALLKEVTVREYRGGYRGVSVRLTKGVRYH